MQLSCCKNPIFSHLDKIVQQLTVSVQLTWMLLDCSINSDSRKYRTRLYTVIRNFVLISSISHDNI